MLNYMLTLRFDCRPSQRCPPTLSLFIRSLLLFPCLPVCPFPRFGTLLQCGIQS